jgi:hypothetical protein
MLRRKFITTSAKTLSGLAAVLILPHELRKSALDLPMVMNRTAAPGELLSERVLNCDKIKVSDVCKVFDHRRRRCAQTTPVWQLPGKSAYFFVAKMAIDVDGAPRAYHPLDKNPPDNHTKALDWLANLDPSDRHGIQGRDGIGPEPGFVVSGTTLENPAFPLNDTRHWVDAETIPYIVLVSNFPRSPRVPRIQRGDSAMVIDLRSSASTSAIFADVGSAVGEASLKTAVNLGLDPTTSRFPPKVRGFDQDFLYIVFPDSKINPPWNTDEIERVARKRFESWGGMEQVMSCFPRR